MDKSMRRDWLITTGKVVLIFLVIGLAYEILMWGFIGLK